MIKEYMDEKQITDDKRVKGPLFKHIQTIDMKNRVEWFWF